MGRALGILGFVALAIPAYAQANSDIVIGRNSVLRQWGGTNEIIGNLLLLGGGKYELFHGTLICSNIIARSEFPFSSFSSQYLQTGGTVEIQRELRVGRYCGIRLDSGTMKTGGLVMEAGSFVGHSGGIISNSGVFVIDSGYVLTAGQASPLGTLRVTNAFLIFADPSPTIRFGTNDPCMVRFADSREQTWHAEAVLDIENWDGATNGGGRTRLIFGEGPNGLTTLQTSRIRFRDPAGFPPGTYYARMLNTGEVVPTIQPTLVVSQTSDHAVVDWPGPYMLQMATNVAGPYIDMPGAQAPFTNTYKPGVMQFFRVRVN